MKVAFYGAARAVTGSKHLIKLDNETQILLDCGLFQGMGDITEQLNESFGFDPKRVNYVILSHAHIDHCGLLPRFVVEGFMGTIFCTPATKDLVEILLLDSAKIQMQDADYANKKMQTLINKEMPLYDTKDVERTLLMFKTVPYEQDFQIDKHVTVRFTDAGHIVGSAAVHLQLEDEGKQTRITFSGDVGRYGDLLLKSPQTFPQADYIIMESTYGDSLHVDQEPIENMLSKIITQTCLEKKGKVIIPAFSVGRTQELLFALNSLELKGLLPDIPYYVDSPLSIEATAVLKKHPEVYNNGVKEVLKVDHDIFDFKGLRFIESVQESIALNSDPQPCVIISSSGMAEGGRVRHHIRNNISDRKNTILMVGYASPRSLAGRLLAGQRRVWLFAQEYDVIAQVQSIKSMSAHGDYEDLLKFLSVQDPAKVKQVFLVHGEYDVQQKFAQRVINAGFKNVAIPEFRQQFDL